VARRGKKEKGEGKRVKPDGNTKGGKERRGGAVITYSFGKAGEKQEGREKEGQLLLSHFRGEKKKSVSLICGGERKGGGPKEIGVSHGSVLLGEGGNDRLSCH